VVACRRRYQPALLPSRTLLLDGNLEQVLVNWDPGVVKNGKDGCLCSLPTIDDLYWAYRKVVAVV
jgi:hypothetical protein